MKDAFFEACKLLKIRCLKNVYGLKGVQLGTSAKTAYLRR